MVEKKNSSLQLVRSEQDRMIAGVCAGIAQYFAIDVTVIRFLFILVTLLGGSGVLVYIILWLIIPTESKAASSAGHTEISGTRIRTRRENSRYLIAFFLIVAGTLFFLNNMGLFEWFSLNKFWPLILVLFGLTILLRG